LIAADGSVRTERTWSVESLQCEDCGGLGLNVVKMCDGRIYEEEFECGCCKTTKMFRNGEYVAIKVDVGGISFTCASL